MIYIILIFRLLDLLGFNSLDYIKTTVMKEYIVKYLVIYLILLPTMFIFFGTGRGIVIVLTIHFLIGSFNNMREGEGILSILFQNLDNIKSLYIILLMIVISIWISLFFYNNRDLG